MSATGQLRGTWEPPHGWLLMPNRGDLSDWIDSVADKSAGDQAGLREDLARFVAFSTSSAGTNPRRWIAALHPDPSVRARVVAAGWISVGATVDLEQLATIARGGPRPASLFGRQVHSVKDRRRSYVTMYDLIYSARNIDEPILHERAAAVAVHHLAAVSVTVEVSTTDLSAFEDLAATCANIATSVRFPEGLPT